MSMYTVEVMKLFDDPKFNMFDFEYDFYTDDPLIRNKFEQKFIDTYLYYEIGFETVRRFKHFLKTRLNNIAPYYRQLYESELRAKDIDFMLNKDLEETFSRDMNQYSDNQSTSTSTIDDSTDYKESSIANGNASLSLESGALTTVNKNTNTATSNITDAGNARGVVSETTTLVSKGNIGITSSAELLEKWRKVMINIDNLIIKDLSDLFLKVY